MKNSIISKAIADGLITFESLCNSWKTRQESNCTSMFIDSEVLDAVLLSCPEWVDCLYRGKVDCFSLTYPLYFANDVRISGISLLGLAIGHEDGMAEEVIRKHYRLLNKEVSSVIEITGNKRQMLGEDELRQILKLYKSRILPKDFPCIIKELLAKFDVVDLPVGKKYFTPEAVNALFMLFSSIGCSPAQGYKVIECSDFKMVPNCDGFDLSAGLLRSGSSTFADGYDSGLNRLPAFANTLRYEEKAALDYDWTENALKLSRWPDHYYGYRTFSADKIIIRKMSKKTKEWIGDAFELTSIWPERQLVVSEDEKGFIRSFAPIFLTRQKGHKPFTPDHKEFNLFIEEEAACFKEMRSKIWDGLEKNIAKEFCINVAHFHDLLLWLERHCS